MLETPIPIPDFEEEKPRNWLICDRFRFEKEDVVGISYKGPLAFYKLVYPEFSPIQEKVIAYQGNFRVGYASWNAISLCSIYVLPEYRGQGIGKYMLEKFVPTGLSVFVLPFVNYLGEAPLTSKELFAFYKSYKGDLIGDLS